MFEDRANKKMSVMVSKRTLEDFKERTVNVKDYEMLLQRVLELNKKLFSEFKPKMEVKT